MAQENTNATEGLSDEDRVGYHCHAHLCNRHGSRALFSRWATRTDMFDGTLGLNAATPSALSWPAAAWAWACCSSLS